MLGQLGREYFVVPEVVDMNEKMKIIRKVVEEYSIGLKELSKLEEEFHKNSNWRKTEKLEKKKTELRIKAKARVSIATKRSDE